MLDSVDANTMHPMDLLSPQKNESKTLPKQIQIS